MFKKDFFFNNGITNKSVVEAMCTIRRENFVEESLRELAYCDSPLPIDHGQTISQPYIVAMMAELLEPHNNLNVLEIGSGCGYHTAILSKIFNFVYSIERVNELAFTARRNLLKENISNFQIRIGNGFYGWPEKAPFKRIILTASPPDLPRELIVQLSKDHGILVAPIGEQNQYLYKITRMGNEFKKEKIIPVRFVPMVNAA